MSHDRPPVWQRILTALLAGAMLASLPSCGIWHSSEGSKWLRKAEEYSRQGDYDQAIDAYRRHIQERLEVQPRPEWENPYFYLVLIGDIELGRDRPAEALSAYQEAEKRGVDMYLIADRIRSLAGWYEKNDQLDAAIGLLNNYRDKDSLMIDAMLDRLSKELTRREDNERLAHTAPMRQKP